MMSFEEIIEQRTCTAILIKLLSIMVSFHFDHQKTNHQYNKHIVGDIYSDNHFCLRQSSNTNNIKRLIINCFSLNVVMLINLLVDA